MAHFEQHAATRHNKFISAITEGNAHALSNDFSIQFVTSTGQTRQTEYNYILGCDRALHLLSFSFHIEIVNYSCGLLVQENNRSYFLCLLNIHVDF